MRSLKTIYASSSIISAGFFAFNSFQIHHDHNPEFLRTNIANTEIVHPLKQMALSGNKTKLSNSENLVKDSFNDVLKNKTVEQGVMRPQADVRSIEVT
jgi:hypothetical protein